MADFENQLKPVDFNFDLRKNRDWFELEREIAVHIRKIAFEKKIPTRILVNQGSLRNVQYIVILSNDGADR